MFPSSNRLEPVSRGLCPNSALFTTSLRSWLGNILQTFDTVSEPRRLRSGQLNFFSDPYARGYLRSLAIKAVAVTACRAPVGVLVIEPLLEDVPRRLLRLCQQQ